MAEPEGKGTKKLLGLLLGGGVLYYLWSQYQASQAALKTVATPQGAALVSKPAAIPAATTSISPIVASDQPATLAAVATTQVAIKGGTVSAIPAKAIPLITTEIANISNALVKIPVVGQVAGAAAGTIATAIGEQIAGNFSTGNILTDVAIVMGPMGWAAIGVGKLFGIDLFGHSLDNVHDMLFCQITNASVHNNVQPNATPMVMDQDAILHSIFKPSNSTCSSDILWCANFSWRAIIAVDPAVWTVLLSVGQGVAVSNRNQITTIGRPTDPAVIRGLFGNNCMFCLGNDTTVHGPWEGGIDVKYIPGGPADLSGISE